MATWDNLSHVASFPSWSVTVRLTKRMKQILNTKVTTKWRTAEQMAEAEIITITSRSTPFNRRYVVAYTINEEHPVVKQHRAQVRQARLVQMPQLRFNPSPPLTVGKIYDVLDTDGSNFIVRGDDGENISLGSSRFSPVTTEGGNVAPHDEVL
jgi:hypothetical protein